MGVIDSNFVSDGETNFIGNKALSFAGGEMIESSSYRGYSVVRRLLSVVAYPTLKWEWVVRCASFEWQEDIHDLNGYRFLLQETGWRGFMRFSCGGDIVETIVVSRPVLAS